MAKIGADLEKSFVHCGRLGHCSVPVVFAVTLPPFTTSLWLFGESGLYGSQVSVEVMVLKGTTRLLETRLKIKGKRGKVTEYTRFLLHVPSKIAMDSQFPFKPGQELAITVDPKGKIVLSG